MDISMMEEDYDRYDADLQRRGAAALAELQVLRAGVAEQERLSRVVTTERARLAEVRSVRVAPGYSPARYNRVEAAKAKQLDSIRAEISALSGELGVQEISSVEEEDREGGRGWLRSGVDGEL